MPTILIATSNRDKLNIISSLLVGEYDIYSLRDVDIGPVSEEIGSIQDRAKQKATEVYTALDTRYDLYMGVDDGIKLPGESVKANSKEITDLILAGAYPAGSRITVVRAFSVIRSGDQKTTDFECRIPLVFGGNPRNIARAEQTYPLSQVLRYEGSKKVISDLTPGEVVAHDSRLMRDTLRAEIQALSQK